MDLLSSTNKVPNDEGHYVISENKSVQRNETDAFDTYYLIIARNDISVIK